MIAVLPLRLPHQRSQQHHPQAGSGGEDAFDDLIPRLGLKHPVAGRAVGRADPGVKDPQEVVDLGHRRDR